MRVQDAEPSADGGAQGHDRCGTDLLQTAGDGGIITGVDQRDESTVGQLFSGLQGLDDIREQGVLIGDDFDLDEIGGRALQSEQCP